jgi:hypothetical protein
MFLFVVGFAQQNGQPAKIRLLRSKNTLVFLAGKSSLICCKTVVYGILVKDYKN